MKLSLARGSNVGKWVGDGVGVRDGTRVFVGLGVTVGAAVRVAVAEGVTLDVGELLVVAVTSGEGTPQAVSMSTPLTTIAILKVVAKCLGEAGRVEFTLGLLL